MRFYLEKRIDKYRQIKNRTNYYSFEKKTEQLIHEIKPTQNIYSCIINWNNVVNQKIKHSQYIAGK